MTLETELLQGLWPWKAELWICCCQASEDVLCSFLLKLCHLKVPSISDFHTFFTDNALSPTPLRACAALHISPYSLSIQCILSLFSDLDIVLYCNSSSIVEVKLLPLRQQARKQFDAEFATRPLLKKMDFDNTEENYSIYKVGAFFDLGNRTPPRPLALEG